MADHARYGLLQASAGPNLRTVKILNIPFDLKETGTWNLALLPQKIKT